MKALVIGGTRFLGLRLVRHLANEGHDITILNRGKTEAQLPPGIKRLYADRRDPDAVRYALQGQSFDVIFDITGYQARNLEPLVELFAGGISHYVFQSTAGVYTESEIFPILEDFPRIIMLTQAVGLAAYEAEKVQCEDYLLKSYRERGFPVTILRCPVIYGPENWMHEREFSFFVRFLQGRKVLVPGDGTTTLPFAHVDDVARAHLSVAGRKETLGQAYNIAAAEAITINGYLDAIAEILKVEAKKVYLEPKVMRGLQHPIFPFRWDRSSFYGIYKAKEHFGFWPDYSIKEGLRHTYEWWNKEMGIAKTQFIPGRLGYGVDLDYEDELMKQYESVA